MQPHMFSLQLVSELLVYGKLHPNLLALCDELYQAADPPM